LLARRYRASLRCAHGIGMILCKDRADFAAQRDRFWCYNLM
jgi:hypothetical protein